MVRLALILTRLRFVKSMRQPDPQRGSAASGVSWSGAKPHRRLVPLGRGTVIFTGASASLRGRPGYAQFAAAKAGLRMIAQSMAREYGPQGIHVAHVIIDGGIDGERLRAFRPQIVEERGEALAASAEGRCGPHPLPRPHVRRSLSGAVIGSTGGTCRCLWSRSISRAARRTRRASTSCRCSRCIVPTIRRPGRKVADRPPPGCPGGGSAPLRDGRVTCQDVVYERIAV